MRRWVKKIAVCAALGVVTTVVVAWGCWLHATWPTNGAGVPKRRVVVTQPRSWTEWTFLGGHTFGVEHWNVLRLEHIQHYDSRAARRLHEPGWLRAWAGAFEPISTSGQYNQVVSAGWPVVCVGAVWRTTVSDGERSPAFVDTVTPSIPVQTVLLPRLYKDYPLCLPLRVIPTGLLIDSILYAGVWALPIFGLPVYLRRRRLRRQWLCAKCSYDLRGLNAPRCPECGGATIPSSSCQTPPSQPA